MRCRFILQPNLRCRKNLQRSCTNSKCVADYVGVFFKKIPAAVSTASHYNFYSTVMYNKTHHIQQNPIQYLKYDHLQQNSAKNTQSEQTSNIHIKPKKHIYNHLYHTTTSLYQSIQHRSI